MLKSNIDQMFLDLDSLSKDSREQILNNNITKRLDQNLDVYKDMLRKTFDYFTDKSIFMNKRLTKKIIKGDK